MLWCSELKNSQDRYYLPKATAGSRVKRTERFYEGLTRTGIWVEFSGQHPDEGRLSGSVFAEHDQNLGVGELTGLNVQTGSKADQ